MGIHPVAVVFFEPAEFNPFPVYNVKSTVNSGIDLSFNGYQLGRGMVVSARLSHALQQINNS